MSRVRSIKKVFADCALTSLSTIVSVGMVQVVVYPNIAATLDNSSYGFFLTLIGIVNSVMPAFGSTLCNTRIVKDERYRVQKIAPGDFKFILFIVAPTTSAMVSLGAYTLFQMSAVSVMLLFFLLVLGIVKCYMLVAFRLRINPKMLLATNIAACIGYGIGLLFFLLNKQYLYPFLFAEVCSILVISLNSRIACEPIARTPLFKESVFTYTSLVFSNLISYTSTYIDRILLYPALGPSAVSIYFAASFFGKAFTFLVAPLSSVLLSYLSDGTVKLNAKRYDLANIALLALTLGLLAAVVLVAPFATELLYPSLYQQAAPYFAIGNAASILAVINSLNMTIVLKTAPSRWQIILTLFRLALYVLVVFISASTNSLETFCRGLFVVNALNVAITYFVGRWYLKT